jgi:S1-C subfamily serine protease
MKPGDVVTQVAGRPVANMAELLTAVAALPPTSRAQLGVQRGAERIELDVTVGERPPLRQR